MAKDRSAASAGVIDREAWAAMSVEEQDALIASGWHPGLGGNDLISPAWLFKAIRHSLNQLTDHGSQGCLDCLHHRNVGMEAVNELERLYKRTVTKTPDLPITEERPRDVGASGAAT